MDTSTEVLALNAKLQIKKNALRKMLREKGVLKKGGNNTKIHIFHGSTVQGIVYRTVQRGRS